jgi:hypothetical protein
MGGPSPEKGPGNRRQHQVDTTPNRRKTILYQMLPDSLFAVNRTVVTPDNFLPSEYPGSDQRAALDVFSKKSTVYAEKPTHVPVLSNTQFQSTAIESRRGANLSNHDTKEGNGVWRPSTIDR